ncbi:DM13 domain-containing protein [Nonomuraea candida]|uniref:DM13 domain-containing protein n=1 Tax=Nonomuraea candida TaxID=359159 RepID=UPI001B806BFC|nr:DM13 domain-containing protein [Nonomuraea candida]
MTKPRSMSAPARLTLIAIGVLALAVALYLFQPWRVFTTVTVSDPLIVPQAAPAAPAAPAPAAPAAPAPAEEATLVAAGEFRSLEHDTSGRAELVSLGDGRTVVQFAGLDTSDGPDLYVYLSDKPASAQEAAFGTGFISLGKLKGNRGDQVYAVPADADLSSVRSVVIWCKRFSAGFGVAPLNAT